MGITRNYEDNSFWGICGRLSLYEGTYLSRKAAIDDHILALYGTLNNRDKNWEECRANGDRAVKLRITYNRTE